MNPFVNILTQDGKKLASNRSSEPLYQKLLDLDNGDGSEIIEYLEANPMMLGEVLVDTHTIYDYLYDYTITNRCHPIHERIWYNYLIESSRYLDGLGNAGDIIKADKRYVYMLQHNSKNYLELFTVLIETCFDVGDFQFLLHSIVARGELSKLKILCEHYDGIEKHTELVEVALRFGRIDVLSFLVSELDMPVSYETLDFPNYIDNPRIIYYHQDIGKNFENFGDIIGSSQNYSQCIDLILDNIDNVSNSEISVKTLEIWCALCREKTGHSYLWDRIPSGVLVMIKDNIRKPFPMHHDFGEFNNIIFGDWINHSTLVSQHISLQEKYQALQERYDILFYKYRLLSDRFTEKI
jgi:hypothetical protein